MSSWQEPTSRDYQAWADELADPMTPEEPMTETPEQRKVRVQAWTGDTRDCRVCGYKRINIRHEPDPANAPEGPDYYRQIASQMHPFVPR